MTESSTVLRNTVTQHLYPVEHLYPCVGCCCAVASCYFGGKLECCKCVKTQEEVTVSKGPKIECCDLKCCGKCCTCCQCGEFECCDCSKMDCCQISCSAFTACCCLDLRYALPQVAEVPCIVSCLFVTCFYEYMRECRICATMADLGAESLLKGEGDTVEMSSSHGSNKK